jgi:hypothetical protein
VKEEILEVDLQSGLPKLLEQVARGYDNSVAYIL